MHNTAVLLKKFSGEEGERVDVQKLFGYIGLFTLVALWWLGKCNFLFIFLLLFNSNHLKWFFIHFISKFSSVLIATGYLHSAYYSWYFIFYGSLFHLLKPLVSLSVTAISLWLFFEFVLFRFPVQLCSVSNELKEMNELLPPWSVIVISICPFLKDNLLRS